MLELALNEQTWFSSRSELSLLERNKSSACLHKEREACNSLLTRTLGAASRSLSGAQGRGHAGRSDWLPWHPTAFLMSFHHCRACAAAELTALPGVGNSSVLIYLLCDPLLRVWLLSRKNKAKKARVILTLIMVQPYILWSGYRGLEATQGQQ